MVGLLLALAAVGAEDLAAVEQPGLLDGGRVCHLHQPPIAVQHLPLRLQVELGLDLFLQLVDGALRRQLQLKAGPCVLDVNLKRK